MTRLYKEVELVYTTLTVKRYDIDTNKLLSEHNYRLSDVARFTRVKKAMLNFHHCMTQIRICYYH